MNHLQQTLEWFQQAIPCPTAQNLDRQYDCILEEVDEFEKADSSIEELDAIADIIVTLVGYAYMSNYDLQGALAEVNRSNFSKFEDGQPLFDSTGKIKKGRDYTPPNLEPFIANK